MYLNFPFILTYVSDSIIAIGCMQTESEFAKAYETGIHKTK